MRCAWQAFLNLIPPWMRQEVDKQGRDALQELRLRLSAPPELVTAGGTVLLHRNVTSDDLQYCVNIASSYSPWSAATSANGYITAQGGHRLGLCGEAIISSGVMKGIRRLTSVCIRVARDFPLIAQKAADLHGSILIIGSPGSGKTTLLRDLIRQKSDAGKVVGVIDQRQEIFPCTPTGFCFPVGSRTDVLSGATKTEGIETVLRCMSPDILAVDEITSREDCQALLHAGWCGIHLLATAHAGSKEDLYTRPVYKPVTESALFDTLIVLRKDKSWSAERMCK